MKRVHHFATRINGVMCCACNNNIKLDGSIKDGLCSGINNKKVRAYTRYLIECISCKSCIKTNLFKKQYQKEHSKGGLFYCPIRQDEKDCEACGNSCAEAILRLRNKK